MSLFAVSVRRFSILFYAGMTLAGLGALLAVGLLFMAVRDLPQVPEPLGRIIETPPTEIFAATGERLMIIGGRTFFYSGGGCHRGPSVLGTSRPR
jgi:penicillin-binding protein 1A